MTQNNTDHRRAGSSADRQERLRPAQRGRRRRPQLRGAARLAVLPQGLRRSRNPQGAGSCASTTHPTSAGWPATMPGATGHRTPTTPTRCWSSSTASCGSSSPAPTPKKGLGNDALAQRFRRIFDNVRNYCRRGVGFARVVQQVNKLHFSDETDVIVLSEIYEDLLKRVAGRLRRLCRRVLHPAPHHPRHGRRWCSRGSGERVYDLCFGTAGFLGEAADYVRRHAALLSGKQLGRAAAQDVLRHGAQAADLPAGLDEHDPQHGIEGANLELANALEVHTPERAREGQVPRSSWPTCPMAARWHRSFKPTSAIRSSATECLFLQHIMANLAKGGRARR
ncbi:MAG: SAM-dependent methyltransferase [Desulfosudis oleivorans]|nr:SAM-dependent methyltransferase [Desulfosudis oleivorans]